MWACVLRYGSCVALAKTPELVPVLSRGKHRSPSKGACFMEFASYLAGERWSDRPSCTHPLLAQLARDVNDHLSDAARAGLVSLIPSVVGLTGDDPRVDVGIAMRSAATALPVAAHDRQRALATGVMAAERLLATLDRSGPSSIDTAHVLDQAHQALSKTPHAARWATQFIGDTDLTVKALRRRTAPAIVRMSVRGIAEACISDPDELLHDLLATAIDDCSMWLTSSARPVTKPRRTLLASDLTSTAT